LSQEELGKGDRNMDDPFFGEVKGYAVVVGVGRSVA